MALTDKRRRAVDHYMKGKTKKQAMLDAGYSESMAATRCTDVFDDPEVAAEIERRQKLAAARSDIDLDWIVKRLAMIADADIDQALDIYSDGTARINYNKLTPELRKSITKFESHQYAEGRGDNAALVKANKVQFADKLRALELLIKHLGFSKEKINVEHSGEVSMVERLHRGRARAGLAAGEDGH